MLRIGDYLQDRYEILDQIGSGGMSVVYKAMCHKLKRTVAIKVLKEEFCSDSNFVSKFKMEAQAAAGLTHPNIVSIYDVVDDGEIHCIVMELIEGITLKSYIARKGRLEIKESIGIAIQVAQGIAAAHEQSIVHRDIKPQNMLISRDGKVKVADFGIARAVSAQTMSSSAMGSVHYISPEQARGGLSDERSDIYSLGITMYEMVTGKVPFDGETTVAIALAHLENVVVPPSVHRPEIPKNLERIILKCTEKKPERRYGSVSEVIHDLRYVLVQLQEEKDDDVVTAYPVRTSAKVGIEDKKEILDNPGTREFTEDEMHQIQEARKEHEREQAQKRSAGKKTTGDRADLTTNNKKESSGHSGIEKLLTGAGIFAAVLIVVILVVVFVKLGGVFRSGSGLLGGNGSSNTIEKDGVLNDTEVYMPGVIDLSEELAEQKLKEYLLNMKVTYEASDTVEKGHVIRQEPKAGEIVAKWSNVNIVISNGSDKIDLTLLGLDSMKLEDARKTLEARKLSVTIEEAESEIYDKGFVISYEPALVLPGESVVLYVSKGPHVEMVEIPDIIGMDESEAIAVLTEAGLLPGETVIKPSDDMEPGYIISQSGGEDGMMEPGGKVNYVISSGPTDDAYSESGDDMDELVPGDEYLRQRYVASINKTFDMRYLAGPGAGTYQMTIMIRLHQTSGGEDIYRTLMAPKTIAADVILPISYTSIESANGTDQGELEVVDVNTGEVLTSYPLTFFPMN